MSIYLEAARTVLTESDAPLSVREITERALELGLVQTNGQTPWHTMKSKLSTDIVERGTNSDFMRTEPGRFGLRCWEDRFTEFVAKRYERSPIDEDVLVFSRDRLSEFVKSPGLETANKDLAAVFRATFSMPRIDAEDDDSVIQLVSFYIVSHSGFVLTHKRTKRLPESRLHGFYSLGFGGHLNPDDVPALFLDELKDATTAYPFLNRELEEELILPTAPEMKFEGLLYDDSRAVSRQHIGLVYSIEVDTDRFEIGERGFLTDAKFETASQIRQRIDQFENWSQLIARELLEPVSVQ